MSGDIDSESIASRLLRYERSQKLCNYLGGGIGGILIVVGLSSNAIINAPWQLISALITSAVVSAICLGRAYIGFLSAQYDLMRYQKEGNLQEASKLPNDMKYVYSMDSYRFFIGAVVFLLVAGALLIAGLWTPPPELVPIVPATPTVP